MREAQQTFQYSHQRMASTTQFGFGATVHYRLSQLQIPVTELVPGELIQNACSDIEAEAVQRFAVRFDGLVELCQNPAVRQRQRHFTTVEAAILTFRVHQHKAAGVPQLVTEVTVAFQTLHIPVDVTTGRSQCRQGEAQRVSTVRLNTVRELFLGALTDFVRQLRLHHIAGTFFQQFWQRNTVNHIQRINNVTLGFRHLLAFVITNQAGHVNGVERHLRFAIFIFDEVHGHHDHAGNPEEDDVETRYHHAGWVELAQCVGVFRPA